MAKFKVGDKVKAKDPAWVGYQGHALGRDTYTVKKVDYDGTVKLDGFIDVWVSPDSIVAVNAVLGDNSRAANAKFKVGDKVRLSADAGAWRKGETGTIRGGDYLPGYVFVKFEGGTEGRIPEDKLVAANARACNSNIETLVSDLDKGKYDQLNWMPKVIGKGSLYPDGMKFLYGFGYDDEEKVRQAWMSGKYASVIVYKGGSKRGELTINSVRSRNAVVQKAMNASVAFVGGRNASIILIGGKWYYYDNATGKDVGPFGTADDARKAAQDAGLRVINAAAANGAMAALDSTEKSKIKSIASGMPCSFEDGGDSLSGVIKHSKRPFLYIDFDVSKSEIDGKTYYEWYVHAWNRTRKWERSGGQYKIEDAVSAAAQAMRGAKQMIEKWSGGIPLNEQTSVLRETAVNGSFKPNDLVEWRDARGRHNSAFYVRDNGDRVTVSIEPDGQGGGLEIPKAWITNARAHNADTPEGRRIIERAKRRFATIKDIGELANTRDDFLREISRSSTIPEGMKDALAGEVISLEAAAKRKLGFNSTRSTNAVVAKAVARNSVPIYAAHVGPMMGKPSAWAVVDPMAKEIKRFLSLYDAAKSGRNKRSAARAILLWGELRDFVIFEMAGRKATEKAGTTAKEMERKKNELWKMYGFKNYDDLIANR